MIWALIMAGGQGTRFWPESRRQKPKQFLRLVGKRTLLEYTVDRLSGLVPGERILIATQEEKATYVRRLFGLPKSNVIGEPVGCNTAPCAILAAAYVFQRDPEAVLAILPSDHYIEKVAYFRRALMVAAAVASQRRLPITFGVKPERVHTGYGYLETDRPVGTEKGWTIYRLKQFHEKPDAATARRFVRSRKFWWNSGIFVWRADELLKAAQNYLPQAYHLSQQIVFRKKIKGLKKYYPSMPNISIDYGLMEKMKGRILALPVAMGWNDVGDWASVSRFWPHDAQGNAVLGQTLLVQSSGNVIKGGRRLIALVGIHDHVVVDTDDALLIVPKNRTEAIRQVVEQLKIRHRKELL